MNFKHIYPNWLVQKDLTTTKRNSKWICVCNECQHERLISYAQAFNILKQVCRRECKNCQIRLGIFQINTSGLDFGRTDKKVQEKAKESRTGINRSNKAVNYNWLFSPESFSTEEGRLKQSLAKLNKYGSLANGWAGGKTPERILLMSRQDYKDLRFNIFKRDDYTCQICLSRGGNLEMDHIKEWCNYPDLRYEPSNCRTLCHDCHKKTDNYAYKAKKNHGMAL